MTPTASPGAVARRVRALRERPRDAVVTDLTWMGERALALLAPSRHVDAAAGAWRALLYRGHAVACPLCAGTFRALMPAATRPDAVCPRCLSHERHRALWLYLQQRTDVLTRPQALLHLAPERSLGARLRRVPGLAYRSADLDSPLADEHFDVTAIPHPDASFDTVIASHVLEHVAAEALALSELRRILRPGGLLLVMVPVDQDRERTLEDPSISTPQARLAAYWQEDHVRLYGRDVAARLAAAGLEVSTDRFVHELPAVTVARYRLSVVDDVFRCRRPPEAPAE